MWASGANSPIPPPGDPVLGCAGQWVLLLLWVARIRNSLYPYEIFSGLRTSWQFHLLCDRAYAVVEAWLLVRALLNSGQQHCKLSSLGTKKSSSLQRHIFKLVLGAHPRGLIPEGRRTRTGSIRGDSGPLKEVPESRAHCADVHVLTVRT